MSGNELRLLWQEVVALARGHAREAVRPFTVGGKLDRGTPNAVGRTPVAGGGTGHGQGAEPPLGNPATSGHVLSSTVAGVRSWISAAANLSATPSPTNVVVTSDTGTDATIPAADATNAGVILPGEKSKLGGVAAGAQVNVLESVTGTAPIVVGTVSGKAQAVSMPAATPTAPGHMAAADKAKLDAAEANWRAYVQSRGMNLFTNGAGLLGTNYNLSALTFDPVETHGGAGSFRDTVATSTRISDEYIPVDPEKFYRLAAWLKAGDVGGANFDAANRFYLGVAPYDIDNNLILPYYYAKFAGSTDTTLAVALNPGDTTMTLADATGWNNASSGDRRTFLWWPYTNTKGYTYPNYTYSRNFSGNYQADWNPNGSWAAGGISGNVITLRSAWTGPALPVGTPVRNTQSGNGYKYIAASNLLLPNAWTRYEGWIGGLDAGGTQNGNLFPYGTSSVRLVLLLNRNTTGPNTTRVSDIWLSEISSRNLELGQVVEALPTANVAVAAATATQVVAPITLTPGTWRLEGWANILMGAAAGKADLYARQGTTRISPLAVAQLAAAGEASLLTPAIIVTPTADTTYNLAAYGDQALTARISGGGSAATSGQLGLRAVRIK